MRRALIACAMLPLAACGAQSMPQPADDHELSEPLAGRVAGPPQRCLDPSQMTSTRIVAPDTILYSATQKTLWRNTIEGCPALRPLSTIITRQFGSQLCEGDLFRVLEPGMSIPSSFCRLGKFTPYRLPDKH